MHTKRDIFALFFGLAVVIGGDRLVVYGATVHSQLWEVIGRSIMYAPILLTIMTIALMGKGVKRPGFHAASILSFAIPAGIVMAHPNPFGMEGVGQIVSLVVAIWFTLLGYAWIADERPHRAKREVVYLDT